MVTSSKFVNVECADCGNKQAVFNKPATVVKCSVCGAVLAEPVGGIARFSGKVLGALDA
ncbi:MAG: 30S ribosomal protein S27e [Thermoplasmata archaeon HGW-Thermoplasmata-1]|nr:MAG: 30S ribosomal protein S27e [Thermoplasmata archaeon HGW-Thermoplasmata-1]